MVQTLDVPERDRFQLISAHSANCEDLGIVRDALPTICCGVNLQPLVSSSRIRMTQERASQIVSC
jgi:hypothetical protein